MWLKFCLLFIVAFLSCRAASQAQTMPTVAMVFDFQPGDVFHTRTSPSGIPPWVNRVTILGRHYSVSGDTLFYDCRNDAYHVEIVSYSPLQLEYIFDTTYYESKITQLDSSINILWYNDTSSYSDTSVEFDINRCNALIASHSFVYWDSPDPKSGKEEYGVGLGMVHFDRYNSDIQQYDFYMDMFYYKKGTVECGTPDLTTSSINKFSLSNCISVYTNPFATTTTIQSDVDLKDATLTIFDAVGNLVREIDHISGQTILIERDNLPCGMYFFN